MQPFPDFDFLFKDDVTVVSNSLSPNSTDIPSPSCANGNVSLNLDSVDLVNDLKDFEWIEDNSNNFAPDSLSIYEPISPATSPEKVHRADSVGDLSNVSLAASSTSPMSSASSPASQQLCSSSDDTVQDALAALEQKLSQPNYTSAKDNDKVKKNAKDKPEVSYIAMIAKAILSTPQQRMILGDIYKYIMDYYPYYNNQDKAWRNSIRHNLSMNECFIKSGRCEGGKGNYWGIHPTCVTDFANGDFRRRQARKRVRHGMRESMISELPLSRKESIPYVQMGTHGARNSYHPYATPYATYSNRTLYGGPPNKNVVLENTYKTLPNVNVASQMSYPSLSPVGHNSLSPICYEASSPPSFNAVSPVISSNGSSLSSNGSPTSYTDISPKRFESLNMDTCNSPNVNTSCAYATSNGSQGYGYTYEIPESSRLIYGIDNNDVKSNGTIGYASNAATPNVSTLWNVQNTYGTRGNFFYPLQAGTC